MSSRNIRREDLVRAAVVATGVNEEHCALVFESFLETIAAGLRADGKVQVQRLCTFSTIEKKARLGRNPKTKEPAMITARTVVSFKGSKKLIERMNNA
jgi:integration host factor subunit alpha